MKENKYDEQSFFQKYSEMSRSKEGLKGAGEWQQLREVLPDFRGKKVLDLGCCYGCHCLYAAQNGAEQVLGIDLSEKMLKVAEVKNSHERITYRHCAMEDLDFPKESFDVILSSLALHYIEDYEGLVRKVQGWLTKKGRFVFSAEHPVFTAYGTQDWYYDDEGRILHFPVDRYYYEGEREAVFLGERIIKYHRTLTAYLRTLLKNGFEIEDFVEPQPPENMRDLPGMEDEMRRPMMLIVSAQKRA